MKSLIPLVAGLGLAASAALPVLGPLEESPARIQAGAPTGGETAPQPPVTLAESDSAAAPMVEFAYTMGSDEAEARFTPLDSGGRRYVRRAGGRLWVSRGRPLSLLHDRLLTGDFDGSLSFVLEPDARLELVLRTDDDRRVTTLLRAAPRVVPKRDREDLGPGVFLLSGASPVAVADAPLYLAPGRAHLLRVERVRGETRIHIDGLEVLRAQAPMSGAYRVGLNAPDGGAEVRHLHFRVERAYGGHSEGASAAAQPISRSAAPVSTI